MSFVLKVGAGKAGFEIQTETGEPVDDANRFLISLWMRALSSFTIRTYGYGLVVLYRWMQATGCTLAGLTGSSLVEWIIAQRSRGVSAHTINHRLHTCYQLYRFTVGRDMPAPPSARLQSRIYPNHFFDHRMGVITLRSGSGTRTLRVKPVHRLIEPLSASQVNAFLGSVSQYRDLAIVLLMLLCGLRSREVLLLRLADLDLTEAKFRVQGKGNKERALPLPEPLAMAIRKYLHLERPLESSSDSIFVVLRGQGRGKPMTAAGLRSLFRSRRQAKQSLQIANPHRFRHTFGADMARSGVRLPVLQRMMGHSSGLTTLRYIRLSVDDIADEYNRAIERIGKRYAAGLPN
jgi:integrase/recombinase XerC